MFKENYIITGTIVCESGLHIGGSSDSVDIGGSDNPVIRDVITGNPYIRLRPFWSEAHLLLPIKHFAIPCSHQPFNIPPIFARNTKAAAEHSNYPDVP